jgi:hypothetical protein
MYFRPKLAAMRPWPRYPRCGPEPELALLRSLGPRAVFDDLEQVLHGREHVLLTVFEVLEHPRVSEIVQIIGEQHIERTQHPTRRYLTDCLEGENSPCRDGNDRQGIGGVEDKVGLPEHAGDNHRTRFAADETRRTRDAIGFEQIRARRRPRQIYDPGMFQGCHRRVANAHDRESLARQQVERREVVRDRHIADRIVAWVLRLHVVNFASRLEAGLAHMQPDEPGRGMNAQVLLCLGREGRQQIYRNPAARRLIQPHPLVIGRDASHLRHVNRDCAGRRDIIGDAVKIDSLVRSRCVRGLGERLLGGCRRSGVRALRRGNRLLLGRIQRCEPRPRRLDVCCITNWRQLGAGMRIPQHEGC